MCNSGGSLAVSLNFSPRQTLFLNYTTDLMLHFGFLEKAPLKIIISVIYVFQNVFQ